MLRFLPRAYLWRRRRLREAGATAGEGETVGGERGQRERPKASPTACAATGITPSTHCVY